MNLREAIQSHSLAPPEALAIVPQICEALQFAHDEGIVHRDIKPENVLLDKRGRVKVADFGLAKLLGQTPDDLSLTHTHQVMGTPRYMAPEQMEGSRGVDHRADIYSLGVVFYELLTGELPLGSFDPPSKKVQVDVRLDQVVLRTLAKEPERRYQHASDVKADVETIAARNVPRIVVNGPAAPHRDRTGVVIGLIAVGLIVCCPCFCLVPAAILYLPLLEPATATLELGEDAVRDDITPEPWPGGDYEPGPDWSYGDTGPRLSDSFARRLDLTPEQSTEANAVIQAVHQLYLEWESAERTTTFGKAEEGGRQTTMVPAQSEEQRIELEHALWTRLDAILNAEQQRLARAKLDLFAKDRIVRPGLLGWGEQPARVTIRRVGGWYEWGIAAGPHEYTGQGPELPPEYRRFWHDPELRRNAD